MEVLLFAASSAIYSWNLRRNQERAGDVGVDDDFTARVLHFEVGVLRGVEIDKDGAYSSNLEVASHKDVDWFYEAGLAWRMAELDVSSSGGTMDSEQRYDATLKSLETICANLRAFIQTKQLVDRESLLRTLRKVGIEQQGSLSLLLGGANVGKSLAMRHLYDECAKEDSGVLAIYMDGRKAGAASLDTFIFHHVSEIVDGAAFLKKDLVDALDQISVTDKKDDLTIGAKGGVGTFVGNMVNGRQRHKRGSVDSFVEFAKTKGKFPLILIDEANLFLTSQKGDSTRDVLQDLVSSTKQRLEVNVVMASSEHSFPYTLKEHGVDSGKLARVIFAGEIPPKDMMSFLLVGEGPFKGVGQHLAHTLVSAYGGHLFLISNALEILSDAREEFRLTDPPMVRSLVNEADQFFTKKNREISPRLMNMATFGREDVDATEAHLFEPVSYMNLGAMMPGAAYGYKIVPPCQAARLAIASAYFRSTEE